MKCCHRGDATHNGKTEGSKEDAPKHVAIVGSPNVGKSSLFGQLSKSYVTVSNYPGTTVDVSKAAFTYNGHEYQLTDTPGMYSFLPMTEDEKVSRRIITEDAPDAVVHVVDAKKLGEMLPLTLQLIESGLPVILVLNILDEAKEEGVFPDTEQLSRELGVPVIGAVSTTGEGMNELREAIAETVSRGTAPSLRQVNYGSLTEDALLEIINVDADFFDSLPLSPRSAALLYLRGDEEMEDLIAENYPEGSSQRRALEEIRQRLHSQLAEPLDYHIAVSQKEQAEDIASRVVNEGPHHSAGFRENLSRAMIHPLTGFPILFVILYFGVYQFVGVLGAQTVVDYLEGVVFGEYINPPVARLFEAVIPWKSLQELFVGEFGVLSLGLRYAIALVLPIVGFFFLVFSIVEDSGYLPRLAMLLDRTLKKIGLSGRAVIPLVLGLGCDTMATMVTRTLPTNRERVISTTLLALAVPCSAQLGVIFALLGGSPLMALLWVCIIGGLFLATGTVLTWILPGEKSSFYIELPPLRIPRLKNVLVKVYTRLTWYFKEVLPMFLIASVVIWAGRITYVFQAVISALEYPVQWIGMPADSAKVFLFGFFRRDYGAAGLFDMNQQGALSNVQLLVGCVVLTLFVPCIAQFMITIKERGWKIAVTTSACILVIAFGVGYIVNSVLTNIGEGIL